MPNGAAAGAACDSIRESAARRLFIPSNAYVYCITMKLLLCTTIMLGGARVDYDEGDGGIKRRRGTRPPALSPREILKFMAATGDAFKFQAQIFQSPISHLIRTPEFQYFERQPEMECECMQLIKSGDLWLKWIYFGNSI